LLRYEVSEDTGMVRVLFLASAALVAFAGAASPRNPVRAGRAWESPPPVIETLPDPVETGSVRLPAPAEPSPEEPFAPVLVESWEQPNGCRSRGYLVEPGRIVRVHGC
jgi:hypothetical protein